MAASGDAVVGVVAGGMGVGDLLETLPTDLVHSCMGFLYRLSSIMVTIDWVTFLLVQKEPCRC